MPTYLPTYLPVLQPTRFNHSTVLCKGLFPLLKLVDYEDQKCTPGQRCVKNLLHSPLASMRVSCQPSSLHNLRTIKAPRSSLAIASQLSAFESIYTLIYGACRKI